MPEQPDTSTQLVLMFGPVDAPDAAWFDHVAHVWPAAARVYCSGGGQIMDGVVDDASVIVTAVQFSSTSVHPIVRDGADLGHCASLGADIGRALADVPALNHVLVFAEGVAMNATKFLTALNETLPTTVKVSGGLASDGLALTRTVVGLNAPPQSGQIVAIGLAGDALVTATGSVGGWEAFGPERIVSRSELSTVFELDGENALDVYKRYLGEFARELPGIALLFPLAVWQRDGGPVSVRTILAVDDAVGSLRFAGDIPQGSIVRLMRTSTDKLIDGAASAARIAAARLAADSAAVAPGLTICVSCIGRRAVMRSRVEEELEEIVFGDRTVPVIGFYSNGEIAPPSDGRDFAQAVLHNQTMTVTTIGER